LPPRAEDLHPSDCLNKNSSLPLHVSLLESSNFFEIQARGNSSALGGNAVAGVFNAATSVFNPRGSFFPHTKNFAIIKSTR
jgi:hypothetical protein